MIVSDHAGYEVIRSWLSLRCGIHYPEHKRELLRQRLSRLLRHFSYADLNEMARNLEGENARDLQLAVMHAASTNHTYFFREPEVLDHFRDAILTRLVARDEMRIWSAAASTGDEAYTLAIMIAELIGKGALGRVQILGTDISQPVVERAEHAVYGERQLAQVPPACLRRYFTPTGIAQYQVIPELRSVCTFRRMNLKATPYPFRKPFQAVFCRNILYYFERADQAATLEAIYNVTEPGGWLITSVTESIRDLGSRWVPVTSGIYRRDR